MSVYPKMYLRWIEKSLSTMARPLQRHNKKYNLIKTLFFFFFKLLQDLVQVTFSLLQWFTGKLRKHTVNNFNLDRGSRKTVHI